MATKTLRVTLADVLGPVGPGNRVHGSASVEFVDLSGGRRLVRYTDGTVVVAPARQSFSADGTADFVVVPNDDATVHADDQGFGCKVSWELTLHGSGGRPEKVTGSKTVAVTSADTSVVEFGSKADFVPIDPGVSYPTEGEVAALIAAAPFLDEATADAAYAAIGDLDDVVDGTTTLPYAPQPTLALPNPAYIAHRCGGGFAPENTLEAARTAVGAGSDGIELDIQPLGDGSLAVIHDTTLDRTTDLSGSVTALTSASLKAANANAIPWPSTTRLPFWREMVAEFGGMTVMLVEPKDASNYADIHASIADRNLQGSVVIATSNTSVLTAAKADGYRVYFYWGAGITSPTPASVVADGADYLGINGVSQPGADVTTLVNTGVPVIPFTVDRRATRDTLLGLGVAGFLSDNPAYLKRTTAFQTFDSWRFGVLGHGFIVNATSPDMSKVTVASGAVTLAQQTVLNAIPGEVCPLANAAGSYVIDVDLGFGTLPASGGSVIVLFGLPDDKNRSLVNAAAFPNGYLLLLRATGVMSLYKLTDGSSSATQIGSNATTAALTAGGFAHLTITVTPTQVTAARTDSAGTIGPVTDSTYRGGYIALGKKDVTDGTVSFKNLAIT